MSNIIHKKESIFHNLNHLCFWPELTETIEDAIERFWETEVELSMLAINNFKNYRDEYFIKNSDFFSSQIRVEHHKPIQIRIDRDFVNNFLYNALESKQLIQNLKTLTNLEVKILNNFCEYLYRQFQELLISPKQLKLTEASENSINIVFLCSHQEDAVAKIMLSIPQDRINMVKLERSVAFSDDDFSNSAAFVKIRVGYAKLTLEELQNLSKDDIVLLDNSNINKLTLISGDVEKDFKVEADKSLILNMDSDDENEEESSYEVKMEKNLWDDIQIELSAEFSKVKMTIGELKQITKGQIVDLGSVFNNEISLYIENRKVAKGELLIINDKYAVRLNDVLSSNVKNATPAAAPSAADKKTATTNNEIKQPENKPKTQQNEDEEFDYSDFEN